MNKQRRERIDRRKALQEWSKKVKARDCNICQMCGNTKFLHSHHILPKELPETRLEVMNGITLCASCHKYSFKQSAHKNGFYFTEWLQRYKPVQYNYLIWKCNFSVV